jgi:UrcA family protein
MNTATPIAVSSHSKTTTLAFMLLALCILVSTVSFADPGGTRQVTVAGTVSLVGLDVLTPGGLRIASWRIQKMAEYLCLQLVIMDGDAATCVRRAVADAQRKLDAVIEARRAEREAQTVASASER